MILDRLFRETSPGRNTPTWSFFTKMIVGKDNPKGPMLTRYRIAQTPYGGLYIHNHHRPDADRDYHDHPWWFCTLVLRGGYREEFRPIRELPVFRSRQFRPGSLHQMLLTNAHRIMTVDQNTWTLLVVSRKKQIWGFWTGSQFRDFVPWTEYANASADPMDS